MSCTEVQKQPSVLEGLLCTMHASYTHPMESWTVTILCVGSQFLRQCWTRDKRCRLQVNFHGPETMEEKVAVFAPLRQMDPISVSAQTCFNIYHWSMHSIYLYWWYVEGLAAYSLRFCIRHRNEYRPILSWCLWKLHDFCTIPGLHQQPPNLHSPKFHADRLPQTSPLLAELPHSFPSHVFITLLLPA